MTAVEARPDLFDEASRAEFVDHLTGARLIRPRPVTRDDFTAHRTQRLGTATPEAHLPAFWSEQIRTLPSGFAAADAIIGDADCGLPPVRSFQRSGASYTRLLDGRWGLIAGEHEGRYDPDFRLYNDVTVLDGEGGVAHFRTHTRCSRRPIFTAPH